MSDRTAPRDLIGVARDASTLTDVLAAFEADGFAHEFVVREAGTVLCTACRNVSSARSLDVQQFRRLEGASDPDDMLAVAAARCPSCGSPGTIVMQYGPAASADHMDVLHLLEDPPPPSPTDVV
jgi:hypothetical protein